jgi:c-di-GMP-binding flagellar brake protein YcgR
MPPVSSNRRLFYRQPMFVRIDVRAAGLRTPVPATLVDLSAGGCRVEARTMLRPQTAVEFDLPRPHKATLRLPGTLRKVTYIPGERLFRYAIEFDALGGGEREELMRFISEEQRRMLAGKRPGSADGFPSAEPHPRLQMVRSDFRVEINLPVRYVVGEGTGPFNATAIDVSAGGIRVITDRVLRQEWVVRLSFTLPSDVLRLLQQVRGAEFAGAHPFGEVRVTCRPLAGVRQSRGRYVQSLAFVNPDPEATREINRFVEAARLAKVRPR